jgi:choline dehydrogenase-like flavoprotein
MNPAMLLDASDLPTGQPLTADLCIVGAGAAGISLALEFIASGLDVLLLESGALEADPLTQALYAGSVSDERLHSPPDRYRQRRFGGTTTIWGGRCMPFDPIDFEPREYLPHSGWPLAYDGLVPYYRRANRLAEAGEFEYNAATALGSRSRPIIRDFESRHFSADTLERFSCPTNFAARYGHKLIAAGNVTVLLHANVVRIGLARDSSRVESLDVRTLTGKAFSVRARYFVIAAGGLETARLLLASHDVRTRGIGNELDLVGRFYMCHVAGTIGAITIDRPLGEVHHGYDVDDEGIYCRRRFALRQQTQRELRIGNFIARLHHPRITDPAHRNSILSLLYLAKPIIPYEYGKRLHGGQRADFQTWLSHLRNVISAPLDAVGFATHMVRDRFLSDRKFPSIIMRPRANLYSLDFHAEQEPNPLSRVTLQNERDALGMQRLNVDWRYTRGDVDTVQRALALLQEDLQMSGVGRFDYDPAIVEEEMTRYGAYGGHHIGTARMGAERRSSVVNADGRVHDVSNLFLAGSATFPTSSQANPTLTVIALSLRLANHLTGLLRRPSEVVAAGELALTDSAAAQNEPS